MAAGDDKPTAAEKGKAKAPQIDGVDGVDGKKEPKKDKDGKIIEERKEEELSEEDQQLKNELDMLVERLQESDASLYKPALDAIKNSIKTSTSSMTAVPKPLKFLRPHYETLEKTYESWPSGENKKSLADVLSVLGMTYSDEERLDTLKYRLLAPSEDLASWGHEYVRHLALQIGIEYQRRIDEGEEFHDLLDLARSLIPFFIKHNAEADAVDLLSELEIIEIITETLDENTFQRVCLYMVR